MRLLLVGAFPYPHHQGSQVYFQEQAIALRAAGAEVSLLTYASALPSPSATSPTDRKDRVPRTSQYWRALDGFEHWTSPGWTSPTSMQSGPNWSKPLGDLGLLMTLRDAIASLESDDAYDAILTHNAEATLIALHGLPNPRPAIVYCIHTLLGNELSAYLRGPKRKGFFSFLQTIDSAGRFAHNLDRAGDRIDRWIAKRIDGWIALTQSADRVMRQVSHAPGAIIAPPLPDPERAFEPLNPVEVAVRHGLEPGRFFLYSGNLDAYQELDILAAAAVELAGRSDSPPKIVIASHRTGQYTGSQVRPDSQPHCGRDDSATGRVAGWTESMPGIEFLVLESTSEMQALLAAARASVVTRRAAGGFPIKLVNSLAMGTPVVAFLEQEWGLTHERNSLICASDRPSAALADALERLANDEDLARRLALGARALYLERHRPAVAASETLSLIQEIDAFRAL